MLYSCALPSVSFCAVHPNQPKILGFVAKHPASDMFHCYIFQSKKFVSNRRLKCITALRLLEDDTTIAKPLYSSKSQNLHLYCPVTDDQQYRWHITPPNPITTVMASQSIHVIIMEVNGAETAPTYTKRSQSEHRVMMSFWTFSKHFPKLCIKIRFNSKNHPVCWNTETAEAKWRLKAQGLTVDSIFD